MELVPCGRCRRHVERASACPFCARRGVNVATAVLAAASLGAASLVAGCGGDPPRTDVPAGDGTTAPTTTGTPTPDPTPTTTASAAPTPSVPVDSPDMRVQPMYGVSQP